MHNSWMMPTSVEDRAADTQQWRTVQIYIFKHSYP